MCTSACVSANVCGCTDCPCGESVPWAVFSRLCRKHAAWSNTPASHGVKSLVLCTSQSSGQSMVNQIYSLSCREQLHNKKMRKKPPVNSKELCRNFIRFKITRKTTQHDSTILLVNYTDECIYFFWIKKKNGSVILQQQIHLCMFWRTALWRASSKRPICESSSIMMRDSPHSSKLLMSIFLVKGLPQCLAYMWDWQKI